MLSESRTVDKVVFVRLLEYLELNQRKDLTKIHLVNKFSLVHC